MKENPVDRDGSDTKYHRNVWKGLVPMLPTPHPNNIARVVSQQCWCATTRHPSSFRSSSYVFVISDLGLRFTVQDSKIGSQVVSYCTYLGYVTKYNKFYKIKASAISWIPLYYVIGQKLDPPLSIRGLSAIKGNLGRLGSESSDEIFIFTAAARSWTFFYGTQKSGGRYVHLEGIPELDRYGSPLLSIMLSIPNCTIALWLSTLSIQGN